jgi:hypothetical protein
VLEMLDESRSMSCIDLELAKRRLGTSREQAVGLRQVNCLCSPPACPPDRAYTGALCSACPVYCVLHVWCIRQLHT